MIFFIKEAEIIFKQATKTAWPWCDKPPKNDSNKRIADVFQIHSKLETFTTARVYFSPNLSKVDFNQAENPTVKSIALEQDNKCADKAGPICFVRSATASQKPSSISREATEL